MTCLGGIWPADSGRIDPQWEIFYWLALCQTGQTAKAFAGKSTCQKRCRDRLIPAWFRSRLLASLHTAVSAAFEHLFRAGHISARLFFANHP
jgi:hypothetical protein